LTYTFGLGGTITVQVPGLAAVNLNIVAGNFAGNLPSGSGTYNYNTNGLLLNGNLVQVPAYFTNTLLNSGVTVPAGSTTVKSILSSILKRRGRFDRRVIAE